MAAINNNPFEFWVHCPDEQYNEFMNRVEDIMQTTDKDFNIIDIFTDERFNDLEEEMCRAGVEGSLALRKFWISEYRGRTAIGGFLKDRDLGNKRLISMPDRITNTISLADGGMRMRPTVINAYGDGDLSCNEAWWCQWRAFMFATPVLIAQGDADGDADPAAEPVLVCRLLSPLPRDKYPALTPEETAHSVALQLLCLALLDAILVHIANAAGPETWQSVRRALADALIRGKDARLCEVPHRRLLRNLRFEEKKVSHRAAHLVEGHVVEKPLERAVVPAPVSRAARRRSLPTPTPTPTSSSCRRRAPPSSTAPAATRSSPPATPSCGRAASTPAATKTPSSSSAAPASTPPTGPTPLPTSSTWPPPRR